MRLYGGMATAQVRGHILLSFSLLKLLKWQLLVFEPRGSQGEPEVWVETVIIETAKQLTIRVTTVGGAFYCFVADLRAISSEGSFAGVVSPERGGSALSSTVPYSRTTSVLALSHQDPFKRLFSTMTLQQKTSTSLRHKLEGWTKCSFFFSLLSFFLIPASGRQTRTKVRMMSFFFTPLLRPLHTHTLQSVLVRVKDAAGISSFNPPVCQGYCHSSAAYPKVNNLPTNRAT